MNTLALVPEEKTSLYKEVRGLARGLELIRALNRMPGGFASTSELARVCGIHRTTTKRLLETLRAEGLVREGGKDGQYRLNDGVRQLSEGLRTDQWIEAVATPAMKSAVRELHWPSDLATLEGTCMVVRESTHCWSMLSQHHSMLGQRMPVLQTALGRAYLAACDEPAVEVILRNLRQQQMDSDTPTPSDAELQRLIDQTRTRGFALNEGEWNAEVHFMAMAVPVLSAGQVLGAINLVLPLHVMSVDEMAERYLKALQRLALSIGAHSVRFQDAVPV